MIVITNIIKAISGIEGSFRHGREKNLDRSLPISPIYSVHLRYGQCTMPCMKLTGRMQNRAGKNYESRRRIAWKTGTSFGYRDGWAIGTTPEYAVGVWVGNADGEGRPGLTGIATAAPVMFELLFIIALQRMVYRAC